VKIGDVDMTFNYRDYFKVAPSTGYETLLHDCMLGDAILFQRADNIEAGWRIVQPILECWAEAGQVALPEYAAGSDGPAAADALLERDGLQWRALDNNGNTKR
jgi:glucose-6-phosphate 1-dehydrogenase